MARQGAHGVVDLHRYREKRGERRNSASAHRASGQARTVILQASNVQPDAEVHRHIGVNDAVTFAELSWVLGIAFALPAEESPWHFTDWGSGLRIDPQHRVAEFLGAAGKHTTFHWGLWDFSLQVVDVYPRDAGTPQALCVGGSGSFPGTSFDLTGINAELTGQETIDEVLTFVVPGIRSVIERSRLLDFVPLLRALGIERKGCIDRHVRAQLATLPREVTDEGQDAFWSVVLGLICLGGAALEDEVMETTMDALGWQHDDGTPLKAQEIRCRCVGSLAVLEQLGATGDGAAALVDRLDILRALVSQVG